MQTPGETLSLRVTMMPRDTNVHGTIFGGIILSYIDQAGAIHVRQHGCQNVVTVAMEGVIFHAPVYVGDVVDLRTRTVRVGRTSVRVGVVVEATRYDGNAKVKVTEAEVVYVNLGPDRRPEPVPAGTAA